MNSYTIQFTSSLIVQVIFLVFNNMIRYTFKLHMNKFSYTTKFLLNKATFFALVMAMLSTQWSTAHIHLAEHHEHDGSHHQHNIEAHSHQAFTLNGNFIDSTQLINDHQAKVVEFDIDCNIHKWNSIDDQPITLTSADFQLNLIHHLTNSDPPEFSDFKRRYIDYSTIKLRAPPKLS